MMGFFTNPKIAFGPGAIEQLAALSPREVTVLVAPGVARLDPVHRLVDWLGEFVSRPTVLEGSGLPPTLEEVDRLLAALSGSPDLIVAVGGGSLIDAAKALRGRLLRPDIALTQWTPLTEVPSGASLRLAAIPTTSGSGSEMSGTAYLLDRDGDTREVSHRALTAEWALLDPEFSRSLPSSETVATGMEAIAHALEALASEWANPFTDAFARDALALGLPALTRLARQPRDGEARATVHYAASRAGLAAANSSLGLAHAWARALLPEVPTAGYGRLLAVALPTVVEYNFPSKRDVYEGVLPLFASTSDAVAESFGARLAALARQLGLPSDLRGAGAELDALRSARDRIVRRVLASTATVANPRVPSATEAGRLLDSMVSGVGRRPP
jgi:alcohol dehydrogenase class IV